LALDLQERQTLLLALNSERFADCAPATVYATLLDEGRYLGSVRTMYRVLALDGATLERRNQRTHPTYTKPELLAQAPNQVWSWDITKLKGPAKWTYFHMYVILLLFGKISNKINWLETGIGWFCKSSGCKAHETWVFSKTETDKICRQV
jgi:hypothetical protein